MMNETKDIRNAGDSNGDGELGLDPSQNGQVYDAVFGTVGTDGPNYHNVSSELIHVCGKLKLT